MSGNNPEEPAAAQGGREQDIAAFFAISRGHLVLYGLGFLALLGVLLGVAALLVRFDQLIFILPVGFFLGAGLTAWLMGSPAGRGCLLTLGLGRSVGPRLAPKYQLVLWLLAGVGSLILALAG